MARNLLGSKTWISAVLAFLMVFTTLLPFGAGVAQAAGGLQFIGISNNTTPTNPHIHYSSTIDIQGTYPTNVDGNDLRYQVTSLTGSQPSDTSSIKPSLDPATRTFTFRNISLIPGVNVIAFSFKNGDSNTDLSKVYVQYSNTPMFSDLRLDTVFMESDPTIVEVNTPRNTTLRLSGKAPNADSIVVTNKTTGKTFTDYIKRTSNTFSVEVETQIGLNEMDIHAYSSNKEVALMNRSVLVIPKSNAEGASDQFYDVKITGPVDPNPTKIEQIPPARTEVIQASGSGQFVISGKLLVKVQDGATILDKYQKDITPPDAPVGLKAVTDSVATTVEGIVEADATVIVKKGNNELGRIQAGSKGEFKFDLNAVQPIGTSLSVTAVDEDKNSSSPSTVIVTEKPDDEKPENPDVAAFDVTTATLTGNAEAGSTVKVMVGNRLLGTDVTLPSGIFSVTLSPGPLPGTTLTVTATDAAGNISDPTAFTISGGPVTRTIVTPEVDAVTNKDTKVTGIAEAHTFIEVYNGNTLLNKNEVQTGDDGKFEVEISSPQPANTRLTVKANDGAGGNSSNEAVVIVRVAPTTPPVTAVPAKPSVTASVSNKDTDISVKITDGSTSSISVKKGAKVLGTKPVTGAGTYVVNIAPVANGDKLSVIATNAKGDSDKAEVVSVVSNSTLVFTLNRLDQNEEISLDLTYEEDEKSILPSGYKIYNIEGATSSSLQSDGVYEMQIGYQTLRQNADNLSNIVNDVIVQNHRYQFVYKSTDVPRFGKVTNVSHPEAGTNTETRIPVKTDGSVNVVNILPAKFEIETFKMGTLPKSSDFAVYFNNSETKLNDGSDSKSKQDYVFSSKSGSITLEFRNLPASETTVKVKYLDDKEISFKVKPEVAPSLLFYYTASRDEKVIDSSLEITDSDPNNFVMDGGVFHGKLYNVSSTRIEVRLNGQKIDNPFYSGPTRNASDNVVWFEIHKDKFLTDKKEWNLKQGNNSLVFSLTDDPRVNFTYNIIYNTEKTPKIEDVTLKVVENKGETELAKKSSDAAYRTSALFLTEFSFKATNVDEGAIATITKDGNVIAKYKLNDKSGNWEFLNDSDFKKSRDAAIKGNTRNLGAIFDSTTFSKGNNIRNKFTFTAEMDTDEYGRELVEELSDGMGLTGEELENRLKLFPMTLAKGGTTNYQIEIIQGSVATRHNISITQDAQAWTVISPTKLENAQYITVNSNSVPIKIFAEKATKVLFGKTEAVAYNTDFPDYKYDSDTGKLIPETYYVFESNVTLKPGLNTIKFTVQFGSNSYNDEIKIFNLNSAVGGAESRDVFGKKLSFSVFEKAFELKFPSGTVLLAPQSNKAGSEVNAPQTDIFTNVPIYFGIADRTNGQVSIDDHGLKRDMEDLLRITSDFNYASPLYYVDAGNAKHGSMDEDEDRAPGGRDPYFDGTVNNVKMEPFIERWRYNLVPSKVGTVSIKYDPSIVNAANNILTVFYNNGDEWINLGGVVNTSKKTVTVPFKGFGYYMVMKTRETFSDVINHPFARDAIETLYAKGIMNDAPGSGFGTELKITRGEFATMLVKALDLPINAGPYSGNSERNPTEPSFNDVHPDFDDWNYEYKYIETAARAGIVRGKSTRGFFPDDPLTREEATIMIARALNLKLGNADAAMLALGKSFTDGQQTGYYAAPSVLAVTKAKIMNGEVNDPSAKKPTYRFNPKGDLTRAEMAIITIRIMTQLKKLPK
ncbi:S-layer protein [Brevibacillus panacihumi W25]|uniref:S-layer protein n=1 Tax=Brevibacillus panacihumi W25 TaxID=1408254 RepID=V6MIS7_9BACL|nr:Ig-like domain-containing protein [Brevibacillus panacihumi]EST55338.1 S-layer protein [Brevibacillus panacihumi W25]